MKKRKKIIIIVIIIIGVLGLLFINRHSPNETDANYMKHFYIAEKNDQKIYLLGTIHITNKNIEKLPEQIENMFQKSDILFLETKFDTETIKGERYRLYENPVEDILSDDIIADYWNKIVNEYNNIREKDKMYNALAIQSIAVNEILPEIGLQATGTIDQYMYRRGISDKKEIIEFEGIEKQYELMSKVSKECPKAILKRLVDKEHYKKDNLQTWEEYCQGYEDYREYFDEESILEEKDEQLKEEEKKYEKIMVSYRNNNMLEALLSHHSKNKFVAIGAGHIYGETGLLSKLEEKGFTINHFQ